MANVYDGVLPVMYIYIVLTASVVDSSHVHIKQLASFYPGTKVE